MLFTVTATFSDFTLAVEQFEADGAESAVGRFIEVAASMADYDRAAWLAAPTDRLTVIHVAGGVRGAWVWTPRVELAHDGVRVYGGVVVQTDPASPTRPAAA